MWEAREDFPVWPIRFIRERAKGAMSDRKKDRGEGSKRKRTKNFVREERPDSNRMCRV